jgi:hypothetical protein
VVCIFCGAVTFSELLVGTVDGRSEETHTAHNWRLRTQSQ